MLADWARLPEGWTFHDVVSVVVDRQDRVYVFCRGTHPMMVFDLDGNLIDHWGTGVFAHPHGAHLGADDAIYCVDDGDHTLRKCARDGTILMTLGTPGTPQATMSGRPFSRPTDAALAPNGDIYVADGYSNAHVHKFSPDGRLLLTGEARESAPESSTFPTTSSVTATAMSMSPTGKATGSRSSIGMAASKPSGTTCTGPAGSARPPATVPFSSASSGRA